MTVCEERTAQLPRLTDLAAVARCRYRLGRRLQYLPAPVPSSSSPARAECISKDQVAAKRVADIGRGKALVPPEEMADRIKAAS